MASRNSQSKNQPPRDDPGALLAQVRGYVAREIALGADFVPLAAAPPGGPAAAAREPEARPEVADFPELLIEPELRDAQTLEAVRAVLGDCRRCKLCDGRTHIVFGVGDPHAEVLFVGEGPGADEDAQGEPFVGRAGKLLTDIIERGMGLSRSQVYIANVIKCRPPNNRNPEPDEIVACEPFLARQIAIIRPRVIVTLGKVPTQHLLQNRVPISKQRGQWQSYRNVPLMPTFHPAYLLRNPGDKRLVWADIKAVMERLGLPLPAKRT